MTLGRAAEAKGRHGPAKGRRIPAGSGFCEAGGMCVAGMNEVHEVAHTRGQMA